MKHFLVIALIGILASCSSDLKLPDAPDDLIPEEEMIDLMYDMTILEAGIQARYQSVNRYYKVMQQSGKSYLKSKGISVERYERSYDYYVSRPEQLQEMYTKVMDSMTVELNKSQN